MNPRAFLITTNVLTEQQLAVDVARIESVESIANSDSTAALHMQSGQELVVRLSYDEVMAKIKELHARLGRHIETAWGDS